CSRPAGRPPQRRRCQRDQRRRRSLHGSRSVAGRGGAIIRTLVPDDDFRVADLHCAYVERVPGFAVAGQAHTGAAALADVDRMTRLGRAEQGDVDRIFSALRTARKEALPKGLSDATLELIVQALGRSLSGLPAAAVAEEAGVSRVTARRYLDHLCQIGRVELT